MVHYDNVDRMRDHSADTEIRKRTYHRFRHARFQVDGLHDVEVDSHSPRFV